MRPELWGCTEGAALKRPAQNWVGLGEKREGTEQQA